MIEYFRKKLMKYSFTILAFYFHSNIRNYFNDLGAVYVEHLENLEWNNCKYITKEILKIKKLYQNTVKDKPRFSKEIWSY